MKMGRRKDNKTAWLIIAVIYIVIILLSVLVTAGLVKIVCWAFGITFMWRYAIGIWALLALVGGFFGNRSRS